MLPNDVEIEPTIIATPELHASDFGYVTCDKLTWLKRVWLTYPGRDMMMEVFSHKEITCERCKANRKAQLKFDAWKAEQAQAQPIEIEMEVLTCTA